MKKVLILFFYDLENGGGPCLFHTIVTISQCFMEMALQT